MSVRRGPEQFKVDAVWNDMHFFPSDSKIHQRIGQCGTDRRNRSGLLGAVQYSTCRAPALGGNERQVVPIRRYHQRFVELTGGTDAHALWSETDDSAVNSKSIALSARETSIGCW